MVTTQDRRELNGLEDQVRMMTSGRPDDLTTMIYEPTCSSSSPLWLAISQGNHRAVDAMLSMTPIDQKEKAFDWLQDLRVSQTGVNIDRSNAPSSPLNDNLFLASLAVGYVKDLTLLSPNKYSSDGGRITHQQLIQSLDINIEHEDRVGFIEDTMKILDIDLDEGTANNHRVKQLASTIKDFSTHYNGDLNHDQIPVSCTGNSSLAFDFVARMKNNPNVEIAQLQSPENQNNTNPDHAFVIIGRDNYSNIEDQDTWGENTVICDAWAERSYKASELKDEMEKIDEFSKGETNCSLIISHPAHTPYDSSPFPL